MRKMTILILAWCAAILVWAVAVGDAADCTQRSELNRSACEAGAGIGVAFILFIGFIGFVFLSLIWFMTRPKGRPCPVCGENVKPGVTQCGKCGHDFAAAAQAAT